MRGYLASRGCPTRPYNGHPMIGGPTEEAIKKKRTKKKKSTIAS